MVLRHSRVRNKILIFENPYFLPMKTCVLWLSEEGKYFGELQPVGKRNVDYISLLLCHRVVHSHLMIFDMITFGM